MKTIRNEKVTLLMVFLMLSCTIVLCIYDHKLEKGIEIQNLELKVWLTLIIQFLCTLCLVWNKVVIDLEIYFRGKRVEAMVVENERPAIIGIGTNAGLNIFGYRDVYVLLSATEHEKRFKVDGVHGKFPYSVGEKITVRYLSKYPDNVVSETWKYLVYSFVFPWGWLLLVTLVFSIQTIKGLF